MLGFWLSYFGWCSSFLESPSLGATFCGRSIEGIEDPGLSLETLTLVQGEALVEFHWKYVEGHLDW